jgi:hypothetical protein
MEGRESGTQAQRKARPSIDGKPRRLLFSSLFQFFWRARLPFKRIV